MTCTFEQVLIDASEPCLSCSQRPLLMDGAALALALARSDDDLQTRLEDLADRVCDGCSVEEPVADDLAILNPVFQNDRCMLLNLFPPRPDRAA